MKIGTLLKHDRVKLLMTGVLALGLFVALAAGSEMLGAKNGPVVAVRVALVLAIVISAGQWARQRWSRAAHQDASAAPPPLSTPKPTPGFSRRDAYVIAAVMVAALLWLAASQRYTVTSYHLSKSTYVYQRTDRLTGRAELWIVSPNVKTPRPAWVTIAGRPE